MENSYELRQQIVKSLAKMKENSPIKKKSATMGRRYLIRAFTHLVLRSYVARKPSTCTVRPL